MKKRYIVLIVIGAIISSIVSLIISVVSVGALVLGVLWSWDTHVEEYTDIACYRDYFGYEAVEPYNPKYIDDSIFPDNPQKYDVEDFKFVYYNPWDAQYLSYLVVEYDDETLEKELGRLALKGIEEYKGIYSATGFDGKYDLVAMNSDEYSGFVYALQEKENPNRIVYVELLFCNYCFDLEYEEYIPAEYLPTGFEAHMNNPYERKMMENQRG